MSEYPEHDKLTAVKDESQAIGGFIDCGGYTLCKYREAGNNGQPRYIWSDLGLSVLGKDQLSKPPTDRDARCDYAEDNPAFDCWGAGFEPVGRPITQILADYFDIDLAKIETEKRAMLDALRAANA